MRKSEARTGAGGLFEKGWLAVVSASKLYQIDSGGQRARGGWACTLSRGFFAASPGDVNFAKGQLSGCLASAGTMRCC